MRKTLSAIMVSTIVASSLFAAMGPTIPRINTVYAADSTGSGACETPFFQELSDTLPDLSITLGSINSPKTYDLDLGLLDQKNLIVYGGPTDVPSNIQERASNGQYRYLGLTQGGGYYFNIDFPPDASTTTDMGTRQWVKNPWKTGNEPNSSYKAEQPNWFDDYSRAEVSGWLEKIQDKYKGTDANPAGNFKNITPAPWNSSLYDIFVWNQRPGNTSPGMVTGWHTRPDRDWYDTFAVGAKQEKLSDLAVNRLDAVVDNAKKEVTISMFSNFAFRQTADFQYKFSTDPEGTNVVGELKKVAGEPVDGYKSTGANASTYLSKTYAEVFTPAGVTNTCQQVKKIAGVPNTSDPALLESLKKKASLVNGIMGEYATTDKTLPIPEEVIALIVAKQKVYLTVSLNNAKSPEESTYENNRGVWSLSSNVFKTPPIDFIDIGTDTGTPEWPPLPEPTVDHYDLICTNDNLKVNVGKKSQYPLTGLTPETSYHCTLEAFDPNGNSGGLEEGDFTTLPLVEPDVPVPGGENGKAGAWANIGLIREINAVKQTESSVPVKIPALADYKSFATNKANANNFTPYFGEKLGAYAEPSIDTVNYKWKFSYTEKERYRKCTGSGANRECEYKYRDVTKYAYDSCPVEYANVGLSGWDGTSIKSDNKGKTASITTKWGKTGTIKVVDTDQKSCRGSDSRNTSNKTPFSYYVPTLVQIDPTLLLDKGFNPTYQRIETADQAQWIKIPSEGYTIKTVTDDEDASTRLHKAAGTVDGEIDFKMLWSRYGNVGTGK